MAIMEQVRPDLPVFTGPVPGPNARAIMERDAKAVSPSYTRCYPLVAARGEGAIIEDVDGNRFLDFNAGIAVVASGHCHPGARQAPATAPPDGRRARTRRPRHQTMCAPEASNRSPVGKCRFRLRLSGNGVVRSGRDPCGMGARFIGFDRDQVF